MLRSHRHVFGNLPPVLAVPAMAVLLTACASSGVPPTASPTTSPSTSSSPSVPTTTGPVLPPCGVVVSPDVVITAQPEPCTVTTHVGATIHIVLDPGFRWDTPTSDSSVVGVVNVERQSSGRLDADLRAAGVGQATVSATGSVLCPPGQPCPASATFIALAIGQVEVTATDNPNCYPECLAPSRLVQVTVSVVN